MRRPLRWTLECGFHWRCPNCGRGPLFAGLFRMLPGCPYCHLSYYPESGYYVGAVYLNFMVSTVAIAGIFLLSLLVPGLRSLSPNLQLVIWNGFGILLCLTLMRRSYSLWLALDFWLNPWPVSSGQETRGSNLPSARKHRP